MDSFYPKAKPKVVDYNPITHMSFYNQTASPAPSSPNFQKREILSNYLDSPGKYIRSTSLAGKNIFSQSNNQHGNLLSSPFAKVPVKVSSSTPDSPRLYKTRRRTKLLILFLEK